MKPYSDQAKEAEAKGEYGRAERLWQSAMQEVQGTGKFIEYRERFMKAFAEHNKRMQLVNKGRVL